MHTRATWHHNQFSIISYRGSTITIVQNSHTLDISNIMIILLKSTCVAHTHVCVCVLVLCISPTFSAYFVEFMQILLFVPVQIAYRNSFNYNQYLNNNTQAHRVLIWLYTRKVWLCGCICIFIKRENAIYLLISSQQNNSFVCVSSLPCIYFN